MRRSSSSPHCNPTDSEECYDPSLLPHHAELLAASAITPPVASARGYRSATRKAELRALGFPPSQQLVPTLLIPGWGVSGNVASYQIRPDHPRVVNGKPLKYETLAGSRMALDLPPPARPWLADIERPLLITEGVRKADAAVSRGLCCIALLGVWNWRGMNEWGGKTVLPDWEYVPVNGREVFIVFDSDVMLKRSVALAMSRLKGFLGQKEARVRLVYLPGGPGGTKIGLDDFLAAGNGMDHLLMLATSELRPLLDDGRAVAMPYRATPAGLVWTRPGKEGPTEVPLTNFTARLVADVAEDDGSGESRHTFELLADVAGRERNLAVPAARFQGMTWTTELGARAIVYPGLTLRDRARAAIQFLSGEIPERQVFTHTGWRELPSGWSYLHAGGAVGASGSVPGVDARLAGGLARFSLPDPPEGDELVAAINASLQLLDLASGRVMIPLYAAIWRAALGGADLSVWLTGDTGVFKSELAALVQQHWGAELDARHLPANWSSTDNALEGLAFLAKDALLVIDDFAPSGTAADMQRLHRTADRVLRGQGNNTGRQRMRADASLRPDRPPRGLILGTGEDVPRGQSLRARLVVVMVERGAVDLARLSTAQVAAADGLYAQAMAGYLRWLAGRYEVERNQLAARTAELRGAAAESAVHRRTPANVASLQAGLESFTRFAAEAGAVTDAERQWLEEEGLAALCELSAEQLQQQRASEPALRFIELLGAAIASGAAHVARADGNAPDSGADADPGYGPETWGWRAQTAGAGENQREEWRPQGARVGWVDKADLYLEPDAAYSVVQRLSRDQGDGLAVTKLTLHKRLKERGFLLSTEDARSRLTVRRRVEGRRTAVLHLHIETLTSLEPAQSAPPAPFADSGHAAPWTGQRLGPLAGAGSSGVVRESAPRSGPERPAISKARPSVGPVGPIGPVSVPGPSRIAGSAGGTTRPATEAEREEVVL